MAQQYKPGDWYSAASGMVMRYDGSVWKTVGQQGTPAAIEAVKGRAVSAPGAAANPNVAEATQQATQQAAGTNVPTTSLGTLSIKAPKANAGGGTALKYPYDRALGSDSDYIIFEFWKYNPPFGRDDTGNTGTNTTSTGTPSYKTYNASVDDLSPSGLDPILLYMPEDIQTQYGQKWGGAAFGSVAAGLMQMAGTSLDLSTAVDSAPGVIKAAVFDKLREGINKVAGANVSENQFMGGISGTILNPNTEMMYDGPELRTLDLTFKMLATSDREAQEIKKICTRFKKAMLPTFGGQAKFFGGGEKGFGGGNLLTIPSICTVKFMYGSNLHPYLPQYKAMAISNVAINYTPDGSYATYQNGSPVATQLKVSLKEMKNIFASEINDNGPSY
jgi:hypothetical protein